MRIKNITVNPLSLGSIEFQTVWECASCRGENILIKKGSLLAEQDEVCGLCEYIDHYQYDPVIEIFHQRLLEKALAIETAIRERLKSLRAEPIYLLGQDLLFGVNTYFARRLTEPEGMSNEKS